MRRSYGWAVLSYPDRRRQRDYEGRCSLVHRDCNRHLVIVDTHDRPAPHLLKYGEIGKNISSGLRIVPGILRRIVQLS